MSITPSFRIEHTGPLPFIDYLPPAQESSFFIRLFLRGAEMDSTLGDPHVAREVIEKIVPLQGPLIAPRQVHGDRLIRGVRKFSLPSRPEGDGVLIENSGIEASLRFADCYPVILASQEPSKWIALLHSGYRGVLNNIAGNTCKALFADSDRSPLSTFAWIGPGIGRRHYSRRRDDQWTEKGLSLFAPENTDDLGDEVFFDLGAQIRDQLVSSGIPPSNIRPVPLCTFEKNDLFYSYRRGDFENRLFLMAFLKR